MTFNYEEQLKRIQEWAESDDGKVYFENIRNIETIKVKRLKRFEEYLETHDFDKLLYRVILEHNDEYFEKCREKGFEEYPNNKLQFILDYVIENRVSIKVHELDCDFPNQIFFFKKYYFQIIYGQGSIIRIYNKDDMRLLLQV